MQQVLGLVRRVFVRGTRRVVAEVFALTLADLHQNLDLPTQIPTTGAAVMWSTSLFVLVQDAVPRDVGFAHRTTRAFSAEHFKSPIYGIILLNTFLSSDNLLLHDFCILSEIWRFSALTRSQCQPVF